MRIYCYQFDIRWEAKQINFEKVRNLLDGKAPLAGSLLVLPEMAFTGFSMNVPLVAREEPEHTESFLTGLARRFGIYIIAGMVTRAPSGEGQNRAIVVTPNGDIDGIYQKIHLFSPGHENEYFQKGDCITRFFWQGGCVVPLICYDLRFPELFRSALPLGAELYVVIASWPAPREDHWTTLLRARSIENQAFVAGVNRCGRDPQHEYSGRSLIIGPDGRILAEAGRSEAVLWADIDWDYLRKYRTQFPVLADRHASH
jgi:omega-amidase